MNMLSKFLRVELKKDKVDKEYIYENDECVLTVDAEQKTCDFAFREPEEEDRVFDIGIRALLGAISQVLSNQPMWMPRITHA